MPEETPITRAVDLSRCAAFAQALVTSLRAQPSVPDLLGALRTGVHGQCPQCGMRLIGEEVLALAGTESPDAGVSPKLRRLWQGFCGRNGCEARFYEVTFDPVPGVEWAKVLADVDAAIGQPAAEVLDPALAAATEKAARRKRTVVRVVAGIVIALLLLAVRQWMTGGSIPFLREAKRFQADPETVKQFGPTNPPAAGAAPKR